ncbi:NHLP-related RiPP peptide [Actinoplanes sp. NPDC023714]|uniref:NHLP-related RiPP peptide n=1 Tax=Actinoplanes sp. NPDC023714 TaxID=3154322 RepID=UPI0033D012F9
MSDAESNVRINISPQQARELLDGLAGDDDFRKRVAANPVAELRRFGITVPADLVPENVELPSPAEIRQLNSSINAEQSSQLDPTTPLIKFGPLVPALAWVAKMPS